jgi:hypothetical protein
MLLLMLGAVIMLMRQIKQPETVAVLGAIFGSDGADGADQDRVPKAAKEDIAEKISVAMRQPASGGVWNAVKDNATFVPAEQDAWFSLWEEVRQTPVAELERAAVGQVTYAQLVNQPNVYRGLPVRVRGRVLRESVKPAPENSLGMERYHQLILAPIGGGDWPVMVYVRELPAGFPRGDDLKVDLSVVGLFFKNWSYPYEGGMGLAPVLVADSLEWRAAPAAAAPIVEPLNTNVIWAAGGAALLAGLAFAMFVSRRTRRVASRDASPPDFDRLEIES